MMVPLLKVVDRFLNGRGRRRNSQSEDGNDGEKATHRDHLNSKRGGAPRKLMSKQRRRRYGVLIIVRKPVGRILAGHRGYLRT